MTTPVTIPALRRIAILPNAFKGTLSAMQAAAAIQAGLAAALPGRRFVVIPLADGGDGTLEALLAAAGGTRLRTRVHDPLGRRRWAHWGVLGDGRTAVIEMAAASGLSLLAERERDPRITSTRGTGEMMLAALDRGLRHLLVGIGGSATSDGGMGMARALGARFLDARGRDVPEGGMGLLRLAHIDLSQLDPRVARAKIEVACDVRNPLTGRNGAAYVYGPQKGATPAIVRRLDLGLKRYAKVLRQDLGVDVEKMPGAGAAGGLGAGMVAFCHATLRPGVDMVMEAANVEARVKGCDLLVTGEGRMDGQTAFGKVPAGVAALGRRLGVPTVAICGSLGPGARERMPDGMVACFGATEEALCRRELARRAPRLLRDCAREVGKWLAAGQGVGRLNG